MKKSFRRFLEVTGWPVAMLFLIFVWERLFGLGSNAPYYFYFAGLFGIPVLLFFYRRGVLLDLSPALARSQWRELIVFFQAALNTLAAYLIFGGIIWLLFLGTYMASFDSPVHSGNKVIFEVDLMRGRPAARFFVRRNGQEKMQLAGQLFGRGGDLLLSQAWWSKDGQVFVCSAAPMGQTPAPAIVYDFSTNQSLRPDYSAIPPKAPEAAIQRLIAAHGGLSDEIIDNRTIERAETRFLGVVKFDVLP